MKIPYSVIENCKTIDEAIEALELYKEELQLDAEAEQNESDNICGYCNGSGEGQYDGTSCFICNGRGTI